MPFSVGTIDVLDAHGATKSIEVVTDGTVSVFTSQPFVNGATASTSNGLPINIAQVGGSSIVQGATTAAHSIPVVQATDQTVAMNGTVTLSGNVGSALGTTNGWTPLIANALSTTVKSIKTSPGQIGLLQAYNPNATVVYIQVFNVASGSVTLGTTTPTLSIPIAATQSGGFVMVNPGINFSTAMSMAATTTATGSTAPTTAVDCNVAYN